MHNIYSPPGNLQELKLKAIWARLDEHIADTKAPESDYFTLPVSSLKRDIGVSGRGVYELVRQSGEGTVLDENCEIWKKHAFVDLVGAGVELIGDHQLPWVGLNTNRPDIVVGKCVRGKKGDLRGWRGPNCERLRLFNWVREALTGLGTVWEARRPDPAIESVVFGEQSRQLVPGMLLCRGSNEAAFQAVFPNAVRLVAINCDSFFEEVFGLIYEMRPLFGEGWLPSLHRFSAAVESAGKGLKRNHLTLSSAARSLAPEVSAGVASNEFLGFGWLAGEPERRGSDLGCGIHVFRPRFLNTWPAGLLLNVKSELSRCRATGFESCFESDYVCIAFRSHDYHNDKIPDLENKLDRKRWRTLPLLPANALSILIRLFPCLYWNFIVFEAGSSRTTPAGVVEKIIELGLPKKSRSSHRLMDRVLAAQIPNLLNKGCLDIARGSTPSSVCLLLECNPMKNAPAVESACCALPKEVVTDGQLRAMRLELVSIRRLFRRVLHQGDAEKSPASVVNEFLADFVGLSAQAVIAITSCFSAPVRFYKRLRALLTSVTGQLTRQIKEQAGRDSDRFPQEKLIEWLFFICGSICAGHLVVSKTVQEWISSHFQVAVILPVDRFAVAKLPAATLRKTALRVGDWQSCQHYSRLFYHEPAEGRIELNLKPLLEAVRLALRPGSRQGPSGWLAAKCSETNELILHLMRNVGYSSNFDLERLPLAVPDLSDLELVCCMDSRLIVRCLKSTALGKAALGDMISEIALQMEKQTLLEGKEAANLDKKINLIESRSIHLLDLLHDPEGLAAAAMEVFREKADTKAGSASHVYFALDQVAEVLWPLDSKSEAMPEQEPNLENSTAFVYPDELSEDKFGEGSSHFGDAEKPPNENSGDRLINTMWKLILDPSNQISKTAEFFARASTEIDAHTGRLPDYMKQLGAKARSGRSKNFRSARERLKKVEDALRRAGHLR